MGVYDVKNECASASVWCDEWVICNAGSGGAWVGLHMHTHAQAIF